MSSSDNRLLSILLVIAVVISLLASLVVLTGGDDAEGVVGELPLDGESELREATARVLWAGRVIDAAVRSAIWLGAIGAVISIVFVFHRLGRSARKGRERDAIGHYLRNAARAEREARRRHARGVIP